MNRSTSLRTDLARLSGTVNEALWAKAAAGCLESRRLYHRAAGIDLEEIQARARRMTSEELAVAVYGPEAEVIPAEEAAHDC